MLQLTRIGGDGVDVGGPDDSYPGPAVVFHAHADAYGDSSNDPHDKYDSKHDASNCRAPKMGKQKARKDFSAFQTQLNDYTTSASLQIFLRIILKKKKDKSLN